MNSLFGKLAQTDKPLRRLITTRLTTGLDAGLPAGRLYCECLANALAVDLLNRYAVRRYTPVAYQGGLPGYRLKRLLDHIGDNLAEDLSLPVLASLAGMSQLGERHARSAYDLCTDVVYHCGPRAPPHLDPGTYLYHYV